MTRPARLDSDTEPEPRLLHHLEPVLTPGAVLTNTVSGPIDRVKPSADALAHLSHLFGIHVPTKTK